MPSPACPPSTHLPVSPVVAPAGPPAIPLAVDGICHGQTCQLLEGAALAGVVAPADHGAHEEGEGVHLVLGRSPTLPGADAAGAVPTAAP